MNALDPEKVKKLVASILESVADIEKLIDPNDKTDFLEAVKFIGANTHAIKTDCGKILE